MQSERFRTLAESKGPFASVYFDDSHDTEDAAAQRDLKWRAIRDELDGQGATTEVIETLERVITRTVPAVGRSGRGIVAGPDGVLLNEHLIRPIETPVVRMSTLPYLVPVVEHGAQHATYVIVSVDHAGADIELHRDDAVVSDTVDAGGYPIHKASSAETPGYGDPQRRTMEAGRKNLRAVADELAKLVDEASPEVIFVVGEVQSRSDLMPTLVERVSERVVELDLGARNSGIDEADLRHEVDQEFLRHRLAAIDHAAQQFSQAIGQGSGLAAEGLHGVCAALRAGAVETLIIGDIGDATVVADDGLSAVAPNENVLSEQGAAATQTLRADEALPLFAIQTGAALIRTDERISPDDGVAAVLRYPLP
ncbi:hypothetical protein A5757_05460 [Mycobacterium sp. 852013-51886_SCH5428379]|uniref:Rv2629 family ribosome hibernation factor n=1 Tax=Mycobacterium sp. 852013-51886_SCH5428379 TaxID=1834111 RepID=UPI0007FC131A|nr:hypothetical protein [Mycobacterium sp. 852013-51886_SCH5428379]OBB62039.1 hypothetical protein A5757_05460 [Mycobacterium sp. 852013-51886_SCH5428379]